MSTAVNKMAIEEDAPEFDAPDVQAIVRALIADNRQLAQALGVVARPIPLPHSFAGPIGTAEAYFRELQDRCDIARRTLRNSAYATTLEP